MKNYVSIFGGGDPVDFESAVLMGKAEDGGLFVPQQLPCISTEQLTEWKGLSYPDLAFELLSLFIDPAVVPSADLRMLINGSFEKFEHREVIPHQPLGLNIQVQELFHGPTLSFKDVAMGVVVNLFDYFLQRRKEKMTLMVATSGDTGPAAAAASIGKKSLSTWLLFPKGLITDEQMRQMTTMMEPNIHAVSVGGCRNGSDDLDDLIAACFADQSFRNEMNLSSVNSINWARVMVQTIHYFYGYLQFADRVGDPVHFSVPCGAFGNMCAGSMAKRMGLPVGEMIVANNANGILTQALEEGRFEKKDIVNTPSSAIDIAGPMNFWRHLYFSLDSDPETIGRMWREYESRGSVDFSAQEHAAIRNGFRAVSVSDEDTLKTISQIWNDEQYLLDPHGAVAVSAAKSFRENLDSGPIVCLATAHPAKFSDTIKQAIGELPSNATHKSMEKAKASCQRLYECEFRDMKTSVPDVMRAVACNQNAIES